MTYADVKDLKPTDFKRFCGVKPHIFATTVKALQQREQQKRRKGAMLTCRWMISYC